MQALKHLSRIHVGLSLSSQPHWIQGTAYSHSCVYYLLVSQCRFAQRSQPSYFQHLLGFIHVYRRSDTHYRFLLVSGMHVLSHTHVGLFSLSSRSQWMQCTAYSHACAYHTPSSVIVFFSVFAASLSQCQHAPGSCVLVDLVFRQVFQGSIWYFSCTCCPQISNTSGIMWAPCGHLFGWSLCVA